MALPRIIADFETQLSTAISVGGTTFDISSNLDDDGVALQAGTYCFTIDNGSSSKEYLIGTLSGSTVSSVSSVSRQGALTSGAVRAHRVGASVMITDFIALRTVAMMIAGDEALDGTSPLIYDTAPTLSDPKELATVAYVLSVVTGGTVNFSSQTISATAGETLSGATTPVRVYFKESDSRWWKVDTDDSTTYENVKLGFAITTATAGNSVTIQLSGLCSGFSGLTLNSKYYGSTTGGMIGTSATKDFAGYSYNATTLLMSTINNQAYIPSEGEKQAMAGGSTFGTPSTSNKFITQDYLASASGIPVVRVYTAPQNAGGGTTTQFDITNPAGSTFRYTYDGTGTSITINSTTFPVGALVTINGTDFNSANQGNFVITGSGTNYFEVTNASGVVQSNVDRGASGSIHVGSVYHFFADSTTQFDITDSGGGTFRYTYDSTGTNPVITSARVPVGTVVNIGGQNFSAGNNGVFVVTASGTNFFEVTNASGVAEADKTIGTGWFEYGALWTKPAGLKYVTVEVQGAGGDNNLQGGTSTFKNTAQVVSATGGSSTAVSTGGVGSGGDLNIFGQTGGYGDVSENIDGQGGVSFFGGGYGRGASATDANAYSAGGYARKLIASASLDATVAIGIGTVGTNVSTIGAVTGSGVVIVTEYYS